MLDRIPERLRTAAEGVERATTMMANAKSKRNQAAGDVGACYEGLPKERTAEWQAAALLEEAERLINVAFGEYACVARKHIPEVERDAWEKNFGAPARAFIQKMHIQES